MCSADGLYLNLSFLGSQKTKSQYLVSFVGSFSTEVWHQCWNDVKAELRIVKASCSLSGKRESQDSGSPKEGINLRGRRVGALTDQGKMGPQGSDLGLQNACIISLGVFYLLQVSNKDQPRCQGRYYTPIFVGDEKESHSIST